MKRQADDNEVIVLGSGLGGLVAGALLSIKRHSVLLLKERGDASFFARGGYRFVPFSNFSERRLKISLLRKVSQALNLPLPGLGPEKGEKKRVAFQVILPKARIDLFCQPSLFRREWNREFPKEVDRVEEFYAQLRRLRNLLGREKTREDLFPLQSRSLTKRFFSFGSFSGNGTEKRLSQFSREFQEFIQLQLLSLGSLFSEGAPASLMAYLLSGDELGDVISEIDLERVKKGLLESFLQSGGEMVEIERVEKVEKGWRKGFALTVAGDKGVFQCKNLIVSSPLHPLSNLLGKMKKRLLRWTQKIRPRYLLFPIFLGIHERVIPVGMKDLLVSIFDMEKPYEGGNVLLLSLSQKGDETEAPEGKRALTVQCLIPYEKLNEDSFTELEKEVARHLEQLIPFFAKHMEFIDLGWGKEQISRWSYPHFLYEVPSGLNWRDGTVPCRIWRDLYFAGKENFPYLGIEGEILSGMTVAKEILKRYAE